MRKMWSTIALKTIRTQSQDMSVPDSMKCIITFYNYSNNGDRSQHARSLGVGLHDCCNQYRP